VADDWPVAVTGRGTPDRVIPLMAGARASRFGERTDDAVTDPAVVSGGHRSGTARQRQRSPLSRQAMMTTDSPSCETR